MSSKSRKIVIANKSLFTVYCRINVCKNSHVATIIKFITDINSLSIVFKFRIGSLTAAKTGAESLEFDNYFIFILTKIVINKMQSLDFLIFFVLCRTCDIMII